MVSQQKQKRPVTNQGSRAPDRVAISLGLGLDGETTPLLKVEQPPGLLHALTRELTRLSLQVSSAKISTYGEKVVDVFYVKNLFGHKIDQPDKLAEIRAALETVLAKGNRPPTPTVALTRRSREPVAAK